MNYGGIPKKYDNLNTSKIVVLPVPFDGTSTWIKGSEKGPDAILEASANMELYDIETDSEVYKQGIYTAPHINTEKVDDMISAVSEAVSKFLEKEKFVVVLGGEHSVSIGAIQAYAKQYKDLTILQFDAHADMRQEYEGSKFNHACVMARAKELCPVVQVGIRSMSVEEKSEIDTTRVFFAHDIRHDPLWENKALEKLTSNVYITIDLDVFDPSSLPSTGTPEPGGLFWYEVMDFLQKVNEKTNVVGMDVVELCPDPVNRHSDFFASKLIYQFLSNKFAE